MENSFPIVQQNKAKNFAQSTMKAILEKKKAEKPTHTNQLQIFIKSPLFLERTKNIRKKELHNIMFSKGSVFTKSTNKNKIFFRFITRKYFRR